VIFGHLGDSNIHVIVGPGTGVDEDLHKVEEIVYAPLPDVAGTVSAEHGVGLYKKNYLHLSRTPEEIALMKRLKQVFDPNNILNRGKIFDL
jgi:FAD/FMN-containing dehydrogenase